jgi:hypothetical protein
MLQQKWYKIDQEIDNNWINPIVKKSFVLKDLLELLSENLSEKTLKDVKINIKRNLENHSFDEKLRNRSKQIIFKVYWSRENYINDYEAKKRISLLQIAFIEMEALFININRKQKGKNWFDHILGVVDELLETPDVDIKHFIIAILHDWPEEFSEYSFEHITNIYWKEIAKSVWNMTKKSNKYYLDLWLQKENKSNIDMSDDKKYELITKTKQIDYYGNMINRWKYEIWVKFADRLDSLKSMKWIEPKFLNKKMYETKKYFLTHEIREKSSKNLYERLRKLYFEKI